MTNKFCSWCNSYLGIVEGEESANTHGICPDCEVKMSGIADSKEPIELWVNGVKAGMVQEFINDGVLEMMKRHGVVVLYEDYEKGKFIKVSLKRIA